MARALKNHVLFEPGTILSSNSNSDGVELLFLDQFSVDVRWSQAAPTGIVKVQGSNDNSSDDNDWHDIPDSDVDISSFTQHLYIVWRSPYSFFRLRFEISSGSITILKAIASGKSE